MQIQAQHPQRELLLKVAVLVQEVLGSRYQGTSAGHTLPTDDKTRGSLQELRRMQAKAR